MVDRYSDALSAYQDTSREAWESFQAHLADTDRRIVQDIHANTGACSDEVEQRTGLKHQTVSAQIRHMVEAGVLLDSGFRTRTRSGRSAIVWTVTPPAKAA